MNAFRAESLQYFAFLTETEDALRTYPKNVLTSIGRPHMVLYVTPRDASAAGRPWDILRTSI